MLWIIARCIININSICIIIIHSWLRYHVIQSKSNCIKHPYFNAVITARKRSLRRLCFYRCLSVILFIGGRGYVWLLPGGCMVALRGVGGMRGCSVGMCMFVPRGEACVVALGECAWLLWGVCVVALGGVCGCSRGRHAWLLWGACMVAPGGAWLLPGGHAWLLPGGVCGCSWGGHAWDITRYWDTINERAVRILLECILVSVCIFIIHSLKIDYVLCSLTVRSERGFPLKSNPHWILYNSSSIQKIKLVNVLKLWFTINDLYPLTTYDGKRKPRDRQ